MSKPPAAPSMDAVAHEESANQLIVGEAVALDLRPAAFVLRAAGAAIDYIAYYGTYFLLLILLLSNAQTLGLDQALTTAISVIGLVLAIIVVPTTVETLSQGKSLGRLAVGARIVRDDGGSIGFRHALIRSFLALFEVFMTFGGMAAIVALLDSRSRRLGDLIAGTYSQNERVSRVVTPVYGVPVVLEEWSRTADVARMPDGLARRIAQFLSQAAALTPQTRARLATGLANEASVYVSPIPAVDPELFLAGVAALRREREFAALELQKRGLERLSPALRGMPRGFPDRG